MSESTDEPSTTQAKLLVPLALPSVLIPRLRKLDVGEKSACETTLGCVPLRRRSSTPYDAKPLSTSPRPERALTPTFRSPRGPCDSPPLTALPRINGEDNFLARSSNLSRSSNSSLSKSSSPAATLLERAKSDRLPRRERRTHSTTPEPPESAIDIMERRFSVGAYAPNKRPLLVRRVRDPLGVAEDVDIFFIPKGKMTAADYAVLANAQQTDSAAVPDHDALDEDYRVLRRRASLLLLGRAGVIFTRLDAQEESVAEEGKFSQFACAPNFVPSMPPTDYDTLEIIAPLNARLT